MSCYIFYNYIDVASLWYSVESYCRMPMWVNQNQLGNQKRTSLNIWYTSRELGYCGYCIKASNWFYESVCASVSFWHNHPFVLWLEYISNYIIFDRYIDVLFLSNYLFKRCVSLKCFINFWHNNNNFICFSLKIFRLCKFSVGLWPQRVYYGGYASICFNKAQFS